MPELRHGYTQNDLHRLAWTAMKRDFAPAHTDTVDRHETAWSAMAELLCASAERPTPYALIGAGLKALSRLAHQQQSTHGYRARDLTAGAGAMRGFQRYWTPAATTPLEDRVIERVALQQILPCLTAGEQQAFHLLAETGDPNAAADILGITVSAFRSRISAGRNRFLQLWHDGEQPSRLWRADRRNSGQTSTSGRRLTAAEVEEARDHYHQETGETTLKALAARYGVSITTMSRLLRGEAAPARTGVGENGPRALTYSGESTKRPTCGKEAA